MNPVTRPWHQRWQGWAVGGLVVGGLLASAAMLAIMSAMSYATTVAVFAAQTPTVPSAERDLLIYGPPVAGSGVVPAKRGDHGAERALETAAPDTVANAMTAVGTAVAAVTLILSVGTTWFALKLKEVEELSTRLKDIHAEQAALKSRQAARQHASELLLDARLALRQWVDESSVLPSRYSILADLQVQLEMLMSTSDAKRLTAFTRLREFLPASPGAALGPVQAYGEACHRLHDGDERVHGLWCRLFSEVEAAALLERHSGAPADFA